MDQLPLEVIKGVQEILSLHNTKSHRINAFTSVGGGCINHTGKIATTAGTFFVKWNFAKKFPDMFRSESKGLSLLYAANAIRIPTVLGYTQSGSYQILLLEFIDSKTKSKDYWELFGTQLAALHKQSQEQFGLDHSNYIGSLTQSNNYNNSWISFFIQERLEAQLKWGFDNHNLPPSMAIQFEALYKLLPSILVEEIPSLVHGDLWSGNLITDDNGYPCLIDPAVYYGHREIDLAMTQLFGGFGQEFYNSYENAFPTSPGLQKRLDIYNLYPLLVHVNLFGQGYLSQVKSILQGYV